MLFMFLSLLLFLLLSLPTTLIILEVEVEVEDGAEPVAAKSVSNCDAITSSTNPSVCAASSRSTIVLPTALCTFPFVSRSRSLCLVCVLKVSTGDNLELGFVIIVGNGILNAGINRNLGASASSPPPLPPPSLPLVAVRIRMRSTTLLTALRISSGGCS